VTKPGLTSHHGKHEHRSSCCPAEPVLAVDRPQAEHQQSLLHIEKMDCPSEESLIRHKFHNVPHISALSFNLLQRKLTVHHAEGYLLQILDDLKEIGLEGSVVTPAGNNNKINTHPIPKTLIAAGVLAFLSEAIHFWGGMGEWPVLALALLSVVLGGFETYKKGWIAIRHVNLNMNALMSIAVTGAMLIGQWPEAAMVMFLFTLAELIEARSMDRARNAISELMKLAPDTVMVQQTDGSWRQQAAEQVLPGACGAGWKDYCR
jgi:Cd2+/Zn2+-exporting ATPase